MKRTPFNCRYVKKHKQELAEPLVETHEGKTYCEGYCIDGGEPAEFCKTCSIHYDRWYAREVQE